MTERGEGLGKRSKLHRNLSLSMGKGLWWSSGEPKNDFTRKMIGLTPLQNLHKNVGDLGKLIVATGFKS